MPGLLLYLLLCVDCLSVVVNVQAAKSPDTSLCSLPHHEVGPWEKPKVCWLNEAL